MKGLWQLASRLLRLIVYFKKMILTLPNYQIISKIYESANSIIYRAVRHDDNQPVILKLLKQDYPSPDELTRYWQGYEITKSLNLDGVIKTYGIEKYQNTLVIILEDFGGQSLNQLMANRPLTVKEFLPIAIQIADSLGNIHAANIIHKDINPSNIIMNVDTSLLKIIDFGLSSCLPRENPTLKNPEQLEGTLAYISPEQTGRMNRALDYRTDLYSLGVTFYELLTEKVPFESTDALELVHCHIAKTPIPIYQVNPEVPPILSDIVMKLMAKNVEDRYQSAFSVKADLQKCQLQLAKTSQIASFEIAQNDFYGKLQILQKLYGRENELETLLQSFERVSQGAAEMMLVAGYSGVGKTALVHEIYKPMTEKRGYFATGKFDQFQRNTPYSAISQAFNEFCNYLLTETTEVLNQWRDKILQAVGNNGQVLIDVIPPLELVIGPQPAIAKVGPTEAKNRFNLVFQNFFQALCQPKHPLILFIDDLQWADSASLNLLKTLMMDTESQYVLIIAAYRDNEVDASHPLMMTLKEFTEAQTTVNTIQLTNLSFSNINTLIAEALQSDPIEVRPLTQLVYEKTQGNAFFTLEFIKSLYAQELLLFNWTTKQWQWQLPAITSKGMTDNVIALMESKIELLPKITIQVLKLAAGIGNRFDLQTLSIIAQKSPKDTLISLWMAIEECLILPLDDNYKQSENLENCKTHFQFQHDRVQQAAYSFMDENQAQTTHLQIGRLLLAHTEKPEDNIFEIVNQFNKAVALVENDVEKHQLAELNLIAGQKAKMATAYQLAVIYLQTGINLLNHAAWQQHYALTLQLHTEIAETAYLNGDFDSMEKEIEIVLQQALTILDKVKVYQIQIQSAIAKNQMLAAIEIGQQVLAKLGIPLSESPPQSLPIEAFYRLPEMTASDKLAAMQMAMNIFSPTYIATPKQVPQLIFTMVTLCINEGNSPLAAFAYVLYGLLLCSGLENIERGYQFGQLALSMLDKFNAIAIKCRVENLFNVTIIHWKEHARQAINAFHQGIQQGLETGDIEYAAYDAMIYCENSYLVGEPLELVSQKQRAYVELIRKIKQQFQLYGARIATQLVLNLRGQTIDKLHLEGEFLQEQEITSLPDSNNATTFFRFYLAKTMLSYLFKDNLNAITYAQLAKRYADSLVGTLPFAHIYFYESLVILAHYHAAEPDTQVQYLKQVTANQQQLKRWAKHAPMNFQHKYDLVAAEKARILGQNWPAAECYEKAIAGAKENQYLHEEALAYELAAEFYLARGMNPFVQTYLKEAHYRYQQWGAMAKMKDLEKRHPDLLVRKNTPAMPTMLTGTSSATIMFSPTQRITASSALDLESVTKAAQTLSGEMMLNHLLEKMMHIVIENAGAEKGYLLLPQKNQWFIEAEGNTDSDDVKVLQSLPIKNQPIAETIIHYVARTKENVVLTNASLEGSFIRDPYIIKHRPKSVLGAPLLNQGQLTGILYLENNLTKGAFTQARLEVLKVLSSQIAISIENAVLYRTLEQKVEERTAQLADANKEITALNKQLKSENLRMSAELDVSRRLQQMLLPTDSELQQIDELDIAGFMEPADEVGGDYYDVLYQDGCVLIGIGDVTGHGLESGALAIMVQAAVRTLLASYQKLDSVKFLSALNNMVYHNVIRMKAEKNMTLALLSYQQGQLVLTGQHEEMIVVRNGEVELIDTIDLGFHIGLVPYITDLIAQTQVSLNPGDVVVLYTDGITEAENIDNQIYGLERLCQVVQKNWQHNTAIEIQQAVIDDVRQFIGEQKIYDDITLLVLKQQ